MLSNDSYNVYIINHQYLNKVFDPGTHISTQPCTHTHAPLKAMYPDTHNVGWGQVPGHHSKDFVEIVASPLSETGTTNCYPPCLHIQANRSNASS
jgi:hypothetical protein